MSARDYRIWTGIGLLCAIVLMAVLPGVATTEAWTSPASVHLAAPTGPDPVGVRHLILPTGGPDPWNPGHRRRLMVDVRYPASSGRYPLRDYYVAGYMSELGMLAWRPGGARELGIDEDSVNWMSRMHAREWAPVRDGGFPVVVVSPPPWSMRNFYTEISEDFASHGCVVVTLDHPYVSPVVEMFPTRKVLRPRDAPHSLPHETQDSAVIDDLAAVLHRLPRMGHVITARADPRRIAVVGWLGEHHADLTRIARAPGVAALVMEGGDTRLEARGTDEPVSGPSTPALLGFRSGSLNDWPDLLPQLPRSAGIRRAVPWNGSGSPVGRAEAADARQRAVRFVMTRLR